MKRQKVDIIILQPTFKNEKDVQKLLGFTGFYQKMVLNYVKIIVSIIDLLRKDVLFK